MNPSPQDRKTTNADRHLFTAVTVALLCTASTYVVPALSTFRPWVPGEKIPIIRLFEKSKNVPAFAGGGGAYHATAPGGDLASELGTAVAANVGTNEIATAIKTLPTDVVTIDPIEYEGIDTFIEDPSGKALIRFYESLLATSKNEDKAVTRIGHYGDSSIATDLITHTLRQLMQQRFGDSGHGFVLAARGYLPYRHRQITHRANDRWLVKEIVRKHDSQGLYGYGGVQFVAKRGARAAYGTKKGDEVGDKVSKFEVYYQQHAGGGSLSLRVDKGQSILLNTRGEQTDAVYTLRVPDGAHRLELRNAGGGKSRVYGVVLERESPGVVYDSLGLVGARGNRLLNFDDAHIQRQIRRRGLHLLILAFGGNEASDNKSEQSYYEDYIAIIDRMRGQGDNLACLLMSPLDQAQRRRGKIQTMRTIPLIISAQRRAAKDRGCAYFNTFEAMGGENSMSRWYKATPRLAMGDFRHATPLGYETIANLFYKALLSGFAGYFKENPEKAALVPRAPSAAQSPP